MSTTDRNLDEYLGRVLEVKYEQMWGDKIGYAAYIENHGYCKVLYIATAEGRTWGLTDEPRTTGRTITVLPPEEEIIWKLQNNWNKNWGVKNNED